MDQPGTDLGLDRPDLLENHCLIDGQWIPGIKENIVVRDPATGEILTHVPDLGSIETERAVLAAQDAFPAWRRRPAQERSNILRRLACLMRTHEADLARIITAEQGKPLAEARGEISYAASYLEWFAEEAKRVYGETIPAPQADRRLTVIKQPVGVVAAITPWNFPSAMVTRKLGPALAVGCTMVLKPSELAPLSSLAIARLGVEAGIPAGVFNVVTGSPARIGAVLVNHPAVRKLTFTGSTAVGKMLMAQCSSTVKRVSMELGGNAPLIVFDDCDLDVAVEGVLSSKFRNAGQTCICANRILVQDSIYDEFARRVTTRVAQLKVGSGNDPEAAVGPLINSAAIEKVEAHLADAIEKGARVLTGGERHPAGRRFFAPTVLAGAQADMRIFSEETFGPVAPLFRFKSEEEAIALANDVPAGLAAYVFTRDLNRYFRVVEALEYGMVGVNSGLISTEVAPFGGIKESGSGREGSHHGVDDYIDLKTICVGNLV